MKYYDIEQKLQDLTDLAWVESTASSGTSGCLLKSKKDGAGNITYYYKLSSYDSYNGIFGFECINEIVACRLLNLLGVEHLQYQLVHAKILLNGKETETWLCKSKSFRNPGEKKIALDTFYELKKTDNEPPLDFCKRYGWGKQISKMFLVDFLLINRDRHGANIEVLSCDDAIRLAPLFDNGLSLLSPYSLMPEKIAEFDPLCDIPVNNFVGSRSLFKNLELLTECEVDELLEQYKDGLLGGLDTIASKDHLEKIWEIIWTRWRYYYENFCD